MQHILKILFFFITIYAFGQDDQARRHYLFINPFNAGINQIAMTYENRKAQNSFTVTAGYIYHKTEQVLNGFGIVPSNYIIANTLYAYNGFILYPGYNHYLKKNPDAWFGVKGVIKFMYHDSLDLIWQWNDSESFTRRVQSDRLYVFGAEFLYGVKTEISKRFFYEIFMGAGIRLKFHNIIVYDSYLDSDPSQHQDPLYPFNERYRIFRPTIHLGINLGLKL